MHTMQAAIVVIVLIALSFKAEAQQFKPELRRKPRCPSTRCPIARDARRHEVAGAKTWTDKRRPEILKLYEDHVYGKNARRPPRDMTFEVTSIDKNPLGGKQCARRSRCYFTGKKDGPKMDLLIYLPADAKGPVPVFHRAEFQRKSRRARRSGHHCCRSAGCAPGRGLSNTAPRTSRAAASRPLCHRRQSRQGLWPRDFLLRGPISRPPPTARPTACTCSLSRPEAT